ncbi:MAG TPA: hypothetical protein ENI31_03895 [Candidatus Omnitrophica bacterium]|nr:hypothetical protein [Candidatus Omnitrophota bacterium]
MRNFKVIFTECVRSVEKLRGDNFNLEIESLSERVFYIWSPRMVEAMRKVCLDLGIEPDNIRMENFLGY